MKIFENKNRSIVLFSSLYLCTLSVQADYDEFVRQTMEQAKQECAGKGWVFAQNGSNNSTCTPPDPGAVGRAIGQKAGAAAGSDRVFSDRVGVGVREATSETPRYDTLPPNDDPRCERYARAAINDFQLMNNNPKCRFNTDPRRWQPNYQNHYNWCLSVPDAAIMNEQRERDLHLRRCGAITNID